MMKNPEKAIWKWMGYVLLTSLILLVLLTVILFYRALNAWTIIGNTTNITYTVVPRGSSLQPIKQALEVVAHKYRMRPYARNDEIGGHSFRWENATGFFGDKKYELSITLQPTAPLDQSTVRDQKFYLRVTTPDAGNSAEWQQVAKDIELAITSLIIINSVSIGLDSAVYGFCNSKERPTRTDIGCTFELSFPVNFRILNETILDPRASQQKKNPKSGSNF